MERNDWVLIAVFTLILGAIEIIALVIAGATSSDVASWVQAIGSIIALGVAILVPWQIHLRERAVAELPRERNRQMLRDILSNLGGASAELVDAEVLLASDDQPGAISVQNAPGLAAQHEEILRALLQSAALLKAVLGKAELDEYQLLRPIMSLRDRLDENMAELVKEANILRRHPTKGVLENSIPTTAYIATDLRVWIEQAQAALQH